MPLDYAYLGATQVSKEILDAAAIDPDLVLSFTEAHRERISGFATYEEYDDVWERVDSINGERAKSLLRDVDPDVVFVMAWPELLDAEALAIPEEGYVGRHLSLLPKRRGRAPVAWALVHGLEETGVSLFWLDEGVDTGDLVAQRPVPIDRADEAADLHEKHTETTIEMLDDLLPRFEDGEYPATPQNHEEATYTHPRRPDMGLIDWTNSATRLYDFVRAQSHPYPGAFTYHAMDKVTAWHARVHHPTEVRAQAGTVVATLDEDDEYDWRVQCGEGLLDVATENEDGNHPIEKGSVLGCTP